MAKEDVFFSEEKKQKTFMSLSRFSPATHAIVIKVFWFFFSKKNCFPALASRTCNGGILLPLCQSAQHVHGFDLVDGGIAAAIGSDHLPVASITAPKTSGGMMAARAVIGVHQPASLPDLGG